MITTRLALSISLALVCGAASSAKQPTTALDFGPPIRIEIEPQLGKATRPYTSLGGFPSFADVNGDTKTDLIIGVAWRGSERCGRALVLLNRGRQHQPDYEDAYWLDDVVPSARIPGG